VLAAEAHSAFLGRHETVFEGMRHLFSDVELDNTRSAFNRMCGAH
jgi:hypothetical protein